MNLELVIALDGNTNCRDFLKSVEQLSTLKDIPGEGMPNFYCRQGNIVCEGSILGVDHSSGIQSSLALIELFRLINRSGDLTLARLSNNFEVNQ